MKIQVEGTHESPSGHTDASRLGKRIRCPDPFQGIVASSQGKAGSGYSVIEVIWVGVRDVAEMQSLKEGIYK